jgi:hypothetical protein
MNVPSGPELLRSPRIRWAIYLACLVQILFTTVEYLFPQAIRGQLPMKDYDAFHVAGLMYWEGILPDAYRAETLTAAQTRLTGSAMFMPWTYPPHFNLLTAGLALLPVWLGYAFSRQPVLRPTSGPCGGCRGGIRSSCCWRFSRR